MSGTDLEEVQKGKNLQLFLSAEQVLNTVFGAALGGGLSSDIKNDIGIYAQTAALFSILFAIAVFAFSVRRFCIKLFDKKVADLFYRIFGIMLAGGLYLFLIRYLFQNFVASSVVFLQSVLIAWMMAYLLLGVYYSKIRKV